MWKLGTLLLGTFLLAEANLYKDDATMLCPVCERAAFSLMTSLQANATQQELEKMLGEVCHILPSSKRSECEKAAAHVVSNLGESSSNIMSKYPPHSICAIAGMCSLECCQSYTQPEQIHLALTTRPTEMAVSWLTLSPDTQSIVQYDTVDNRWSYNTTGVKSTYTSGGFLGTIHTAVLTGLTPDTEYFYRVGDPTAEMLWRHYAWSVPATRFRTAPAPSVNNTVRMGFVGDMGATNAADPSVATLKSMQLQGQLDVMVHVGDISYADGYQTLWDEFFRKIEPLASRVPYMACPGNHEDFFDFQPYAARFSLLGHGSTSSPMYYSLDIGPVHLLSINTEAPMGAMNEGLRPGAEQYEFIAKDLAAAAANRHLVPWIVVIGHRPFVCSTNKAKYCSDDAAFLGKHIRPLFDHFGVDLVVVGHAHLYERSYNVTADNTPTQGAPIYIVNGASGTKEQLMGGFINPPPPYSAFRVSAFGFGSLVATAETLEWRFILDEFGSVGDSVTLKRSN